MKIKIFVQVLLLLMGFQIAFSQNNVHWTNLVGVQQDGLSVVNTSSGVGGASSTNILNSNQDGYIQFKESDISSQGIEIGLSYEDINTDQGTINFGFWINNGAIMIIQNNNIFNYFASWGNENDIFKIQRVNGAIQYLWNDNVVQESECNPNSTMIVDLTLNNNGAYVKNIKCSFSEIQENIVWANIEGLVLSEGVLTKSSETDCCNAGASSENILLSGHDGYVEYKISELNSSRTIALSEEINSWSFKTFEYCYKIEEDRIYIYHYGQLLGNYGKVAEGDFIRIERVSEWKTVLFEINGQIIQKFPDENNNLRIAVSISEQNASLSEITCNFGKLSEENSEIINDDGSSSGSIVLTNVSGASPFYYKSDEQSPPLESFNYDQEANQFFIEKIKAHKYFGKIIDAEEKGYSVTFKVGSDILWKNKSDQIEIKRLNIPKVKTPTKTIFYGQGENISKAEGVDGWDNGVAVSNNYLNTDFGNYFDFSISQRNFNGAAGLVKEEIIDQNNYQDNLTYGYVFNESKFYIYFGGSNIFSGEYNAGDRFGIEFSSAKFTGLHICYFTKNDIVIYSKEISEDKINYHLAFSLFTGGSEFKNIIADLYSEYEGPGGGGGGLPNVPPSVNFTVSNPEYSEMQDGSIVAAVWCVPYESIVSTVWYDSNNQIVGNESSLYDIGAGSYRLDVTYNYNGNNILNSHLVDVVLNSGAVVLCSNDINKNWVQEMGFNGNGNLISSSRIYSDYLGREIQTQVKNYTENKIIASQNIYDAYGRASIQTLEAPLNQPDFCFDYNFITDQSNNVYSFNDYDNPPTPFMYDGEVNNPKMVYGDLGWYYSDQNNWEPYVPTAAFPYSRVEYTPLDNQGASRASNAGALHMGSGHELKTYSLQASGELFYVFGYSYGLYTSSALDGTTFNTSVRPYYNAKKKITIDQNNNESIVFTDLDGKTIAKCLSGRKDGINQHEFDVVNNFTNQDLFTYTDIHVPVGCESYVNIHIPSSYAFNDNVQLKIIDLKTGEYISQNGTDIFDCNKSGTTDNSIHNPLSLSPGIYRIQYNSGGTWSSNTMNYSVEITYKLNYYDYTLNYYDKANRLIKTVPPAGVDYITTQEHVNTQTYQKNINVFNDYNNWCSNDWETQNTIDYTGANHNSLNDFNINLAFPVSNNDLQYEQLTFYFSRATPQGASPTCSCDPADPSGICCSFNDYIYDLNLEFNVYAYDGSNNLIADLGDMVAYTRIHFHPNLQCGGVPDYTIDPFQYPPTYIPSQVARLATRFEFQLIYNNASVSGDLGAWIYYNINHAPHANQFGTCLGLHYCIDHPYDQHLDFGAVFHDLRLNVNIENHSMDYLPNQTMATTSQYNCLNWLLSSTTPDGGKKDCIYTSDGKLRFTQNALQEASNSNLILKKYSYVGYDYLGRSVEGGEISPIVGTHSFMNDIAYYSNTTLPAGTVQSITNDIGHSGWTLAAIKTPSITVYDIKDANFISETGLSATNYSQDYLLGRVSYSYNQGSYNSINDNISKTWYSYDDQGRIKWKVQKFYHMNGSGPGNDVVKTINYSYDFNGNVTQVDFQREVLSERFLHLNYYDQDLRLKSVFTSLDGVHKNKNCEYKYYLHGPLKRIEYGDRVQAQDLVYTINGWLKEINSPDLNINRDPGQDGRFNSSSNFAPDLFGVGFDYFSLDYLKLNTLVQSYTDNSPGFAPDLFNGTIKCQRWRTAIPTGASGMQHANENLIYGYIYDNQYQLKQATFGEVSNTGNINNTTHEILSSDLMEINTNNDYKVYGLQYDPNGNISHLTRNGYAASSLNMDDLSYSNIGGTNKLMRVTDAITNNIYAPSSQFISISSPADYTYDLNGQNIDDPNLDEHYVYNAWGLVTDVYTLNQVNLKAHFDYDEQGKRIRKISGPFYGNKETWYVYSLDGKEICTYESPVGYSLTQKDNSIYGINRLGIYNRDNSKYEYELTDHLGNVRSAFTSSKLAYLTTSFDGNQSHDYFIRAYNSIDNTVNNGSSPGSSIITDNTHGGGVFNIEIHPGDLINSSFYAKYLTATPPHAMLVYDFFDENGNQLGAMWRATPVVSGQNQFSLHNALPYVFNAPPGKYYVSIYFWSIDNSPVWFDDLSFIIIPFPGNNSGLDVPVQLSLTDYYPHGSVMPGRNVVSNINNPHGYQGEYSKRDLETNLNSFDLRQYDPVVGRWKTIDPFGQFNSPYVGMGNDPVNNIDPTGGLSNPNGGFWNWLKNVFAGHHDTWHARIPRGFTPIFVQRRFIFEFIGQMGGNGPGGPAWQWDRPTDNVWDPPAVNIQNFRRTNSKTYTLRKFLRRNRANLISVNAIGLFSLGADETGTNTIYNYNLTDAAGNIILNNTANPPSGRTNDIVPPGNILSGTFTNDNNVPLPTDATFDMLVNDNAILPPDLGASFHKPAPSPGCYNYTYRISATIKVKIN
jgi:RHS repeat-associated protein